MPLPLVALAGQAVKNAVFSALKGGKKAMDGLSKGGENVAKDLEKSKESIDNTVKKTDIKEKKEKEIEQIDNEQDKKANEIREASEENQSVKEAVADAVPEVKEVEMVSVDVERLTAIENTTENIIDVLKNINFQSEKEEEKAEAKKVEAFVENKDAQRESEKTEKEGKKTLSKTTAALGGLAALMGGVALFKPDIFKEGFKKLAGLLGIEFDTELPPPPAGVTQTIVSDSGKTIRASGFDDQGKPSTEDTGFLGEEISGSLKGARLTKAETVQALKAKSAAGMSGGSESVKAMLENDSRFTDEEKADILSVQKAEGDDLTQARREWSALQKDFRERTDSVAAGNKPEPSKDTAAGVTAPAPASPPQDENKDAERVDAVSPGINKGLFDSIKAQIKHHEGKVAYPYKDSEGLWTIGYGHLIGDGSNKGEFEKYNSANPAPQSMLDNLLDKDLSKAVESAKKLPGWEKANDSGKIALTDLTFNMGPGWIKDFKKARAALEAGDFETAAVEVLDSKYADQVGQRAETVAAQLAMGGDDTSSISISTASNMRLDNMAEDKGRAVAAVQTAMQPPPANVNKAAKQSQGSKMASASNFKDPNVVQDAYRTIFGPVVNS